MLNSEFWVKWTMYFTRIIEPAIYTTIRMVSATILLGFIFGLALAILLTIYGPGGLNPKRKVYDGLSFIVSAIRSFPILILIVAISPLTKIIMGTTIGVKAAILPLAISATAFIARLLENSFKEVDKQLIEAARSFGASDMQIMFKVIIKESIPSIISIVTLTIITYLASSTVAGAVGGGGLGAVALSYGYNRFDDAVLYTCVFILLIMVQITQLIGNWLYKKIL